MPKGVPKKRYTAEFKVLVIDIMREKQLSYCDFRICTKMLLVNDLPEGKRQSEAKFAFKRRNLQLVAVGSTCVSKHLQTVKPVNTAFSGIKILQRMNTKIASILCDIFGADEGT